MNEKTKHLQHLPVVVLGKQSVHRVRVGNRDSPPCEFPFDGLAEPASIVAT